MINSSAEFELMVCPNGRATADEYLYQGNIWIEGRENSKYTLKFINRTPLRINVVFSVDGLDTIKGQPAGPQSEGYVVNGNDSIEVPGWTLDNNAAASFYFAKAGKAYVAASGNNTSNTGVIGAMVFKEMPQAYAYPYYPPYRTTGIFSTSGGTGVGGQIYNQTSNMKAPGVSISEVDYSMMPMNIAAQSMGDATSAVAQISSVITRSISPVSQEVGTGFGDAVTFNTYQVSFKRLNETVPDAILAIYYNTAKNLQKMGINIRTVHTKYDNSSANPFPSYRPGCKPPPGWTS